MVRFKATVFSRRQHANRGNELTVSRINSIRRAVQERATEDICLDQGACKWPTPDAPPQSKQFPRGVDRLPPWPRPSAPVAETICPLWPRPYAPAAPAAQTAPPWRRMHAPGRRPWPRPYAPAAQTRPEFSLYFFPRPLRQKKIRARFFLERCAVFKFMFHFSSLERFRAERAFL